MAQIEKDVQEKTRRSSGRWRRLIGEWGLQLESAVPADEINPLMQRAALPSVGFFVMLALATVIATFGLIANSAPAIIGAMIIAPLMAPIMGLSYGLVTAEGRLICRSIATVIAGVCVVLAIAYVSTRVIGLRITGSEVLNRTAPTTLDLGVALAAGAAAAFSYTRRNIANSIAGVAIAVALVPPLAVTGIGLALGRKAVTGTGESLGDFGLSAGGTDIAVGAFVLFLTNLLGIVAIAILVFVSQRYGIWRKALVGLVLFVGLTAILVQPLDQGLRRLWVKSKVVRLTDKLEATRPDIVSGTEQLTSVHVTDHDGVLHVNIEGFASKEIENLQERLDLYRQYLTEEIGEAVVVELEMFPVDMIRLSSAPPSLEPVQGEPEE